MSGPADPARAPSSGRPATDPTTEDPFAKGYLVARLDEIEPTPCPCGEARRAFAIPQNTVATFHITEISRDSRTHYHKGITEIYYVLDGTGHLELNRPGAQPERVALSPGTAVLIAPQTRHRAVGKLRVIVVPIPAFDPLDEHFDASEPPDDADSVTI